MSTQPVPAADPDILDFLKASLAALPGSSRFDEQELELIYGAGCNLFTQNKYDKAAGIFALLSVYRPLEPRYITAHGMCHKLQKRFDIAVQLFSTVMVLEPDNPKPAMHAAECLFALGREAEAVELLHVLLELAGTRGEHAELRERAEGWLALAERAGA